MSIIRLVRLLGLRCPAIGPGPRAAERSGGEAPMEGRTAFIRERMTVARIGYRNEQKNDLDKLRKELQEFQKENEKLRNEVAFMKSK